MDNQGDSNYRWYHVRDSPNFAVGVLTLIAVGIYAWYARQQVTDSDVANSIAKQALDEVNRPYLMFSALYPNNTSDNNGIHSRIGITWTNFGNTPALNPTFYMCKPVIKDDFNPPPYQCDLLDPPAKFQPIGPKQPTTLQGPIISAADLDATREGKKAIYMFGYLKYEDKIDVDPYGNSVRRVTSFCQQIVKQSAVLDIPAVSPDQTLSDADLARKKIIERQLSAALPYIGLGCQKFDYCIDDTCPDLRPLDAAANQAK